VSQQGALQGALASLRGVTGMIGPITFTQILAWEIGAGRSPGGSFGLAALLLAFSLGVTLLVNRVKLAPVPTGETI
jgi:DHA1 family tetracycline resistance protein-like MFS transporter